jgi:hypothetical protein
MTLAPLLVDEPFPLPSERKRQAFIDDPFATQCTCDQVFDEFLAECGSRLAKNDLAFVAGSGYRKLLAQIWRPEIGPRIFDEIRYSDWPRWRMAINGRRRPITTRSALFAAPTVDVAIFGVREEALQVLRVSPPEVAGEPYPGQRALPGGFVHVTHDRDLEGCASRKLKEKTGVAAPI